jgi:hypothetical protein
MEGYLIGPGRLSWWSRIILGLSGAILAFPEPTTDIIGFLVIVAVTSILIVYRKVTSENKPERIA